MLLSVLVYLHAFGSHQRERFFFTNMIDNIIMYLTYPSCFNVSSLIFKKESETLIVLFLINTH